MRRLKNWWKRRQQEKATRLSFEETFTPTTAQVRAAYVYDAFDLGGAPNEIAGAQFDRWFESVQNLDANE